MAWRGFALALLAVVPGFAGCFGGEDAAPAAIATSDAAAMNETPVNATLPDDRGESAGLKETNKTEEGVGGTEHLHDYWQGRETVTVIDERIYVSYIPLYPDGEGSDPRNVAYVKLPNGTLVYEGTNKVTITVSDPQVQTSRNHPGAPYAAAAPQMTLQYLTAADNEWRDAGPLPWDTPLDLAVTSRETDMPHSVASLWVFRLLTDSPGPPKTLHMTVTIHKGDEVVDWPGHPDFYADADRRVVLDTTVKTRVNGIVENFLLYDQAGTWVHPDRLISWGTERLEVHITILGTSNDLDASPDGFYLEHHNATVIGPEVNSADSVKDETPPPDLKEWDFVVPVDEYGMDGPYQPESRWGFRVRATYANGQLCPGCFNYDIEYAIKVVAVGSSTAVAGA